MRRFFLTSCAVAAGIVLALASGCSSRPEIRIDRAPQGAFAGYHTFAFAGDAVRGDEPGRYLTLVDGELRSATRSALERRNYVYSERNPDLLVDVDLQSNPSVISVVFLDWQQNLRVWEGTAQGGVAAKVQTDPATAVDQTVQALLSSFPLNSTGGELRSASAAAP